MPWLRFHVCFAGFTGDKGLGEAFQHAIITEELPSKVIYSIDNSVTTRGL